MGKLKKVFPGDPVIHDITHKRNDDFTFPVRGFSEDGTPYDFTNHSFLMQIKDRATDSEAVVEIPNGSFTISQDSLGEDDGSQNIFTIEHTDDDFDIDAKDYVYDIQMTDATGKIITIIEGIFIVTQDVSRPIA